MKTIRMIFVWLICMMAISCSAQRTFSDLSSIKGVTSVFVGKAMLKIAGSSLALDSDKTAIDISKIIKDLTSVEIITCQDKSAAEKVRKKCSSILSKYPLEVITEVNSDGQNVEISAVLEKNDEIIKTLLISVSSGGMPTYILMKGKIKIEDLNAALANGINDTSILKSESPKAKKKK